MPGDLREYLDPAAAALMGKLEVAARILVEGFLKGMHQSAAKGSSTEFAEHRPYVSGDEIRRVDWRAFARTDRFYLKEYEDETNLRATVILDASASMGYASGPITKLRYASCLAAALGYLLVGQRDAVGLAVVGGNAPTRIPPRSAPRHLRRILGTLEETRAAGPARIAQGLHSIAGSLEPRSLAVVISDFLDDPRDILRALSRLGHRGVEAMLLHVMDPAEEDFPFDGWTIFRDAEDSSASLRIDARQLRAVYRENLEEHLEILREGARAAGLDHVLLRTREPFETALARFLASRSGRRR